MVERSCILLAVEVGHCTCPVRVCRGELKVVPVFPQMTMQLLGIILEESTPEELQACFFCAACSVP